ncbi:MAG: hypothetical protein GC200_09385 [Tepidisphaera sp.]|nr:hypothetical protein [Tepidisphaera sp.]
MPTGTVKSWVQKLRRRALWLVVAVGAISAGLIATTALPAVAVITPAAIAVLVALNSMTAKITETTCLGCGADVSQQPVSARGRICPHCGAVNERLAMSFIKDATPASDSDATAGSDHV